MSRRTLLFSLFLSALCVLAGVSTARAAEGDYRAALVVRFADGSMEKRCVAFSEPSITGAELLARSGLQVIMDHSSQGGTVCSISGSGCAYPTQDCFCRCEGLTCEYWAYYHWVSGGWQYSQVGATGYKGVTDGAMEGWSWGAGNFSSGTEPPVVAFSEVCAPPATATHTATATATVTVTPTPSATVKPLQDEAPPQVVFEANVMQVPPGACLLLRWWVSDAVQITLDGAPVIAQDQREVCPAATQRFVLAASNSAGQVERDLTVTVSGSDEPPASAPVQSGATATTTSTPGATTSPPAGPARGASTAPSATPGPVTVALTAAPTPSTPLPQPERPGPPEAAVAQAQEAAVTAAPSPSSGADPALAAMRLLAAPATPTPRPRRQLGADGRPTPTPILIAYAQPADAAGSHSSVQAEKPAKTGDARVPDAFDRSFSLTMLPGYAAYLITLASLAGVGVWVARRKANAAPRRS